MSPRPSLRPRGVLSLTTPSLIHSPPISREQPRALLTDLYIHIHFPGREAEGSLFAVVTVRTAVHFSCSRNQPLLVLYLHCLQASLEWGRIPPISRCGNRLRRTSFPPVTPQLRSSKAGIQQVHRLHRYTVLLYPGGPSQTVVSA